MRVPARTQYNWHDICSLKTVRRMSWTASRLKHDLRWSDKGIWYSQPRPSLGHPAQIWLSSHFYRHTPTISYRYVCSSCHGWISVIQLSCWSGSEARLCSSPNNFRPASSCNNSCISSWPPIIWLCWNWVSSWWLSLQPATSPSQN